VSRTALYLVGAAAFVVGWQIAASVFAVVNSHADQLFPTWGVIFTSSVTDFGSFDSTGEHSYAAALRVLSIQTAQTTLRVVVGTAGGLLLGVVCGLAMVYSNVVQRVVSAPVQILRSIPLLALIPLFTLWFGGQEVGMYLFIGFAVFVMVVVATFHAALNVPPAPQRFARVLGASRFQLFRDVVIWGMVPELFGTVRVVAALSWSFALGAEYTGAQTGLGYLLLLSQRFGYVGRVVVVTLIFVLLAVAVDRLLLLARQRLLRWA
jgi:ABC-type nitrate/sulfonate/bicarbonate transport system permease component